MTFFEWFRGASGFVKFLLPFLLVIAAAGAATTTWISFDLPIPATREYIRIEAAKIDAQHRIELAKTESKIRSVATSNILALRDLRERIRRIRDGHVARLALATDLQTRDDIQMLILQDNQDIVDVETQIAALEKLR